MIRVKEESVRNSDWYKHSEECEAGRHLMRPDSAKGKREEVCLFGNFGTVNIGNECTLQAMLYNIPKFLPGAEITCICSNPEDVVVRHEIPAIQMTHRSGGSSHYSARGRNRHFIFRLLRALLVHMPCELVEWLGALKFLKGRTMLVITGTGILTDRGEGPLGLPYQIFKWVMTAKLCNLSVLFVSVGVEPISHRLTRLFIKSSLGLADYVSYRDDHSKQYMVKLGLKRSAEVYPDLAFSLPSTALPSSKRGMSAMPLVGVGLYDYCRGEAAEGNNGESRYRDYIKKVGTFIVWLLDNEYRVRILIGDVTYDNSVREDLRNTLEGRGVNYDERKLLDEPISSVSDLLQQIATTDMVVATRFHNVLLALMLNKPVISISYDMKNDSLMGSVGLSNYCHTIDQFDGSRLIKQFMKLAENSECLKCQIEEKVKGHRKASLKQYSTIFANS